MSLRSSVRLSDGLSPVYFLASTSIFSTKSDKQQNLTEQPQVRVLDERMMALLLSPVGIFNLDFYETLSESESL